jgi:hypothetical protein
VRWVRPNLFMWRSVICGALAIILPVSALADDTGAAMLRASGKTLVNGNLAPASSAIFPNDLIQTSKEDAARLETIGSLVDIQPDTMIQFDGDELVLDHGSVSVTTSRAFRVRVGCITVTPVKTEWTNYQVTDTDGKVVVSAIKDNVYIDSRSKDPHQVKSGRSERTIVRESEQKSRSEKCGAADIKTPDYVAGKGAFMNSPWAKVAGGVAIGLTCLGFCPGDDPASPSKP